RADGFVRILRALLLLEDVGLGREEVRAVGRADEAAHLLERVVRDSRRVGAHVRDERRLALFTERDALVEPLPERRRLLRAEVKTVARRLLQLRGDERGGRVALALLLLALRDGERRLVHLIHDRVGLIVIRQLDLLAVPAGDARAELRRNGAEQIGVE